jgi:hypothetical protein
MKKLICIIGLVISCVASQAQNFASSKLLYGDLTGCTNADAATLQGHMPLTAMPSVFSNAFVQTLYTATNNTSLSNSATETSFLQITNGTGYTVTASNFFVANTKISVTGQGAYWTPGVNLTTATLRVKIGGTTVSSASIPAFPVSATAVPYDFQVFITCQSVTGTTAKCVISGGLSYVATVSGFQLKAFNDLANGTAPFNVTNNQTNAIDVTLQFSGATSGLAVLNAQSSIIQLN